jgi:hypothetical protein
VIAALASAVVLATSVGPGPVSTSVPAGAYSVAVRLTPNLASRTGSISVAVTRRGRPVAGARVRLTVSMLDMNMGSFTLPLPERRAGTYARMFPVVGMSGRWGFRLDVTMRRGRAFRLLLADRMLG